MKRIHPKVLAGAIAGIIGTLGGALLKARLAPGLTVAEASAATIVLSFLAAYATPGPDSFAIGKIAGLIGQLGASLAPAAPVVVNVQPPAIPDPAAAAPPTPPAAP